MVRIGQEGLNNFLADHRLRFLLRCVVRAPGSAVKRRAAPSSVSTDKGIAITMLLIHHVERAIALRDTSALLCALMDRMMSFPARLVQWCGYWAKSAKMTIVGRNRTVAGGALGSGWKSIEKRLQMALLSAPWGPNSTTKPKPRHLVGKKIILVPLTEPMHREIASRR